MRTQQPWMVSLLLVACAADAAPDPGRRVLLEGEPDPDVLEQRQTERQARMNIDVVQEGIPLTWTLTTFVDTVKNHCNWVVFATGTDRDPEINDFSNYGPCTASGSLYDFYAAPLGGCAKSMCRAQFRLCVAQRLMAYATTTGTERADWHHSDLGYVKVEVGPQDAETKIALAQGAFYAASEAAFYAGEALQKTTSVIPIRTGDVSTSTCLASSADRTQNMSELWAALEAATQYQTLPRTDLVASKQMHAEALAMSLIEATQVAQEAADLYTQENLGVADAEFSRTRDVGSASLLSWTDATMSRAAAAHVNVGSGEGLHYFWGQGICPVPQLTAGAKEAVKLFRQSAMDPRIIQSDLDIVAIIEGSNAAPLESLRARIAERTPDSSLRTLSAEQFASAFDLTVDDISHAREYLRHEMRAFGRDPTVALPPAPVGRVNGVNNFTTTINYAATAMEPTLPPDQYYVGLTRFSQPWDEVNHQTSPALAEIEDRQPKYLTCATSADCQPWEVCTAGTAPGGGFGNWCMHAPGTSVTPPFEYARKSAGHVVDFAASVASDVTLRAAGNGALSSTVIDVLAAFGANTRKQAPRRVETCYRTVTTSPPETFRIRVLGQRDPAKIRIVRGVAGLRCAELGTIDGAACNLADHTYTVTGTSVTLASTARKVGFADYSEFTLNIDLTATNPEWLYVIEQKDGFGAGLAGGYRAIAAHKPQRLRVTNPDSVTNLAPIPSTPTAADVWAYCSLAPVVPARSHEAAEILAPSPENCGAPKNNCTGFDFADRLPLENEITEDGFDPESSWRHYLDEAMAAANYADELGKELVNHGFEIDKAIEAAQAELEMVCGVPVNLRDLAWGSLEQARAGTCTSQADCPAGYECFNDQCVTSVDEKLANAQNNASAQDLLACVGEATVADYVAAGSDVLCAWKKTRDSTALCELPTGATATLPCPFAKPLTETCAERIRKANLVGVEPITIDKNLNLFDPIPVPDAQKALENTKPLECRLLEVIRNNRNDTQALTNFIDQFQLTQEKASQLAQGIGWQGYPDDYSAIIVSDQPRWSTGDPAITAGTPIVTPNQWPCGFRGASTPEERAQGACSVDLARPMPENCVADCAQSAAGANRDARVRMNHQMARAVLAMKLAAGVPLTNVIVPYQPHTLSYVWFIDQGEEACQDFGGDCDFLGFRWTFDTQGVSPIFGGRELRTSESVTFRVWESNNEDEEKDIKATGDAYCHHTSSTIPIWTHINAAGGFEFLQPSCTGEGARSRNEGAGVSVVFRPLENLSGDAASAARIWSNLHPSNPIDEGRRGHLLEGLVYKLLTGEISESTPVFSRDTAHINADDDSSVNAPDTRFTLYFHHCYGAQNSQEHYCYRKHPAELEFNRIPIPANGMALTGADLLNGLQLMCEVAAEDGIGCEEVALTAAGQSLQDLRFAERALECVGQQIENNAALTVLQNVPNDMLPENVGEATYTGTRGGELSTLVGSFNRLIMAQHGIGSELKDLADDIQILENGLRRTGIAKKIAQLNTESQVLDRGLQCINATLSAAAGLTAPTDKGSVFNPSGAIFGGSAAVATCANSFMQISLAYERLALEEEDIELQNGMTWANFRQKFRAHADAIEEMGLRIDTEMASLQGALGAIESQRIAAQRHLGQALMATADATGRTYATNAVMRARYNTTRIRYDEAVKYAKNMSYMARRALEQRIGIDLMDLDEDLAFVESPRTWASEVCTFAGVNYQDIASGNAEDYSKTFIGDYVRRLERVKESYDVDFPFTEGTDTAVISMRDDITMARAMCSVSVNNLLASSADLTAPEWQVVGCGPAGFVTPICDDTRDANGDIINFNENPCGSGVPYTRACGFVTEVTSLSQSSLTMPLPYVHQDGTAVEGYQVTFGKRESTSPTVTSLSPGVTALAQDVLLPSGLYRLSWRAPDVAGYDGKDSVKVKQTIFNEVIDGMGNVTLVPTVIDAQSTIKHTMTVGQGWPIHYLFFQLPLAPDSIPVRVQITSNSASSLEHTFQIGAFMLEDVTGQYSWAEVQTFNVAHEPGGYIATTEAGAAMLPFCEDTTGENFREQWTYGCAVLCEAGYDTCRVGERQCYHEKSFNLALEDIESESVLSQAGFAYGNYNYRIEMLGLNVVGTGTRDCGTSALPSTCFASGNFPVSIYHDGPYDVRNHLGDKYKANLFRGVVEHARGLAAERYITNPISSADEQLLTPYLRHELAGRPLSGRFTVRVWDQDGVNFNGVEDIQILLKYRYWTRAE